MSHNRPPARHTMGFTLVELLVVISIIGVLMALILPSMKMARQAALAARCGSQLRQSGVSVMRYAYDFKEWGPSRLYSNANAYRLADEWLQDYYPNPLVLRCPTDTVRAGTQGAIGGLYCNNKTELTSSYFHLFGLGNYYGITSTASGDVDHFFGWRYLFGSFNAVPNLQYLSRTVSYTNKNFGTTRVRTLLDPSNQAIAADGYRPNSQFFYGAVPDSTNYNNANVANNTRNVMHPDYDGINVQYADGHVTWTRESQVQLRFTTGSGLTTDIYW